MHYFSNIPAMFPLGTLHQKIILKTNFGRVLQIQNKIISLEIYVHSKNVVLKRTGLLCNFHETRCPLEGLG